MKLSVYHLKYYLALFVALYTNFVFSNQYNFGHINYSNGLSHNHVFCFAEDNDGFLWIGTRSGLNRYDGYNCKTFKHDPSNPNSLPVNTVEFIVKDQLGRLWVGLPDQVSLFNPKNESFDNEFDFVYEGVKYQNYNIDLIVPMGDSTLFFRLPGIGILQHNIITNQNYLMRHREGNNNSISGSNISQFVVQDSLLYIIYTDGLIDIYYRKAKTVIKRINEVKEWKPDETHLYQLFVDRNSNIWVYLGDLATGLIKIDRNNHLIKINTETSPALNSNIISGIIQDPQGNLWIGTDHGGINLLNKTFDSVTYLVNEPYNFNSLSQNVITRLYMSHDNIIWIGTYKQGVNYYQKNLFRFNHYMNYPTDPNTLPYNDVNCFTEDKKGNLWIGTNGHGLIYFNRKKNTYVTIRAKPGEPDALQSDVIVSLLIDINDVLWIGTYHGGLSSYNGNSFTNYMNDPNDPGSISDNKVWDIFEDSKGNLWIGTLAGGLDLFDRDKDKFIHYSGEGIHSINARFIMDITEDKEGNLWFGTDDGVYILDHFTSRFIHYTTVLNTTNSLSDNFVYNVFNDSRDNIWVGTRNGLNLYVRETNSFIRFSTNNGLPDNSIMGILESNYGNLWVSTSNGLSNLLITFDDKGHYKNHFAINYTEWDGLQGREFNEGSALKTREGELIFGGPNGFNLFVPNEASTFSSSKILHIYGLEIFGKEIEASGEPKKKAHIRSNVLDNSTIRLKFRENMFSLKFVNVDFLNPKRISYRYKLEGFNDQWIYTGWGDRKATFTNLSPGKYKFVVQASHHQADWNKSESYVNLVVLPPWYRTWIAYVVYSVVFLMIIFLLRQMLLNRERNLLVKEEAIKESERQHELNVLKTRFFTNVSHELKTPLSLIITPLQNILKADMDAGTKKHLRMIYQNAERLLSLVNQLLDFRKAEENKLSLNLTYGNINVLIGQIVDTFTDLAETKKIDLRFLAYESEIFMQFDKDKIEKIISNLLSNAFKFSDLKGSINVITRLITSETGEMIEIRVEDKGIGMNSEQRAHLFERFYQADLPAKFITSGSGIGLSLTKDFVELHGGTISVESEPGKGSRFSILLPVNRSRIVVKDFVEEKLVDEQFETDLPGRIFDKTKKTIMLVEDNDEFRNYLRESLSDNYNIIEAENGKASLTLLESKHPDLIISDIMMPEIDGIQLCNRIKTDPHFSHIPIILLTAKSTEQDKIGGLQVGADEYITKPFNLEILGSRIEYLLGLREKFIREYQKTFKVTTNNNNVTLLDQKLLNRSLELINKNLDNSDFSVEKLSSEVGISRVYLYKKISALTGKTPVELIRLVRLRKAAELLLESQLTISEIAYEVGFNDPKYFARQFKAEFEQLPSVYRQNVDE